MKTIATFYQFTPIENPTDLKNRLLHAMHQDNILGTIILAPEGVNSTVAGESENITHFLATLKSEIPTLTLEVKKSYHDKVPFTRAKVNIKQEIVTLSVSGLDPRTHTGDYIAPQDWNRFITNPEVITLDMRNDYEVAMGTFKGAHNPHIPNFRSFPEFVKKNLNPIDQDRTIASFCTGGIRCEKGTAYLKSLGFSKIYQLQGGILKYLEEIPAHQSLWMGDCFVFDDRGALNQNLKPV